MCFSPDRHQARVAAGGGGVDADRALVEQEVERRRFAAPQRVGGHAEDGGDRAVAARDLAGEDDQRGAFAVGQRRVDAVSWRGDRDALA